ncbi:MAG TPA: LacI family DNA-binding transcriptional regulator [Buttiauxella sp.]|uniref:LacI family DNA-binding transcriptional regulator n=1 Tax=Buttiauxella sp. TaxID=1972222 RepID=UPI002B47E0A1|nr:LacI family DNA-binding transcriptional regulator [Buttiauxella sp.]HKM98575.1 LacI family DNA-binding transcriptional regulator [Buttiauxella sp.]
MNVLKKTDNTKNITIKSLAKELEVSHTTISNAWNNPDKLSLKLRNKILSHAQTIGFQGPDPLGRALRTGKSDTIGIIFNDSMSYVFIDQHDINLMRGIAMECEKQNTNLVLIPLNNRQRADNPQMTTLVDGYILNATHNNEAIIQQTLARQLPIVTLDFSLPQYSSVAIDNAGAMHEICLYLLAKGHRCFGIIAFPSHKNASGLSPLSEPLNGDNVLMLTRVNACREAFISKNVSLENCWLFETQHDEAHAENAAQALLSAHPDITALICLSDRFAAGAVHYCLKHHISIPQQVAITGFDNTVVDSQGIGLTTISQDARKKGETAVKLLLQNGPVTHYQLHYQLICRDSA